MRLHQVEGAFESAVLERKPCGVCLVGLALRGVRVLLANKRSLLSYDAAVLKGGVGVTEDEVNSAQDYALAVELSQCVRVECVLPAIDVALVEGYLVCAPSDCHRLMARCACRV